MDGAAEPAYQFLPNGMFGALPNPPKLAYDPAAAKKLLAEAGYPNGFQVTLSTTNDRYINDSQITQAVAQYLTQVGIRPRWTPWRAPSTSRAAPRRSSAWRSAAGAPRAARPRPSCASGRRPRTRRRPWAARTTAATSDPEFDKLLRAAIVTLDDAKRSELLQQAGTKALEGGAFIPLHFESSHLGLQGEPDL